jgi:glutamate synthase domain-containing protein 3
MHPSRYIGTGMHGGAIYLRGPYDERFLGKEVGVQALDDDDWVTVRQYVGVFAQCFGHDTDALLQGEFHKLYPRTKRPYGRLYAY